VVDEATGYVGPLENGHWLYAANLQAGDRLLNADGTWTEVLGAKAVNEPLLAYNLTVDGFHTYFVAANEDAAPVWVHNANCWLPEYSQRKLQHEFHGHAEDFGIPGTWNKNNGIAFQEALEAHKLAPNTQPILGTYRGTISGTHYYSPETGLWSFYDDAGSFVAGWKLSTEQVGYLLSAGNIQ